jgi:hypothetical protein
LGLDLHDPLDHALAKDCGSGAAVMTKDEIAEAAERVRKAAKGLNFEWLEDDAMGPDDRPRDLTPWAILALAASGEL